MNIAYVNGEFIPLNEAKISILDRGFLFGDSVYEVIPVFQGKMFELAPHLERLQQSLQAIHLTLPVTSDALRDIFCVLLQQNHIDDEDLTIYLQITRGFAPKRSHALPDKVVPNVVAFLTPSVHQGALFNVDDKRVKSKRLRLIESPRAFSAITLRDTRRQDCYIKSTSLLPNVLLYHQAKQVGAIEAILYREQYITEGTASNVFIVKDSKLLTPPKSPNILNGITRQLILKLAKNNGIAFQEAQVSIAQLKDADEVWVTGSAKEIYPITVIDGKPVGDGEIGPMWHRMMQLYEAYKQQHVRSQINGAVEQQ